MLGELEAQKDAYLQQQLRLREQVKTAVAEAGLALTFKEFRRWYEHNADFGEWIRAAALSGVERGLYEIPDGTEFTFRRFPSMWMFVTYDLARIVYAVGDSRRIRPSDLADAHHIAVAPYVNLIVSDDRLMRAAAALMPVHPRVVTSAEFTARLGDERSRIAER